MIGDDEMNSLVMPKRALLGVYDKTGVVELAKMLQECQVELVSTGGTLNELQKAGLKAVSIKDYTGRPEILDGRVKTLQYEIHAGILYMRNNPQHVREMEEQKLKPIDMVVCNLYPFEQKIKEKGATFADCIENIDIGGPTMLAAAAKNWEGVAAVSNPHKYRTIALEVRNGGISRHTRWELAVEARKRLAEYYAAISVWHNLNELTGPYTE